jgi:thiol:disulfide interchange protein
MSGRRALLCFVILLGLASGCASAQQPWLDYAVENADTQKKPLVVEFYATWCKPCKHFEADVLIDPRVQQALAQVSFVRYDIDHPTGRDAMARCGASAVPTVVGIDRHGTVRLFKAGTGQGAEEFLSFLAQTQQVLGGQWGARD